MKKISQYMLFSFLLIGCFVTAGQAEVESALYKLGRDPFDFSAIKPLEKIIEQDITIEEERVTFELRATLVARNQSIANLNGKILMKGDEIEGYRLREIGEDEVVLEKDGVKHTISLKK